MCRDIKKVGNHCATEVEQEISLKVARKISVLFHSSFAHAVSACSTFEIVFYALLSLFNISMSHPFLKLLAEELLKRNPFLFLVVSLRIECNR